VGPAFLTGKFLLKDGGIAAEQILNINSLMILLVMIPVGYFAGKFKALSAICVGVACAVAGICISGFTMGAWAAIVGVVVFTMGEMLASPRTKDFMASSAPPEKKGLYLGYSEVPNGIGWAVGSYFAGNFYEHHGDKVNFARQYLVEHGMDAEVAKHIPKEKVMEILAGQVHMTVPQATKMLWDSYHPSTVWYYIAAVGAVSLVALVIYNVVITRLDRDRELTSTVPAVKSTSPVN
jgi:MFS family permease